MKVIEDPTMLLLTFTSGESYYLAWSKKNNNLRIVLPIEDEEKFTNQDGTETKKEPQKNKKEHLRHLIKSGVLLNGNNEHEENVTTIDTHSGLKLIVSGDASGLIKLWNFKRQLIREIKFTEPISAVCFLNREGDLVVGHKGKVSKILAKDYLPH